MNAPAGIYPAPHFGAGRDGNSDATKAVQAAIDAAGSDGGGIVVLPPGRYRIDASIRLRPGVTLTGAHDAPVGFHAPTGTIILATGGRDDEDASALFEMGDSSAIRGITIRYPDQKPGDIRPYPWAIHMTGSDNTVENVTVINAWNGIRVGPEGNCRHRIRSVYGCFLRRGVWVDNTLEIGRIENCQFHTHWWSSAEFGGDWETVLRFQQENLEAFTFGRTDWEYVTNNFVFGCRVGYRFIHTKNGECNGHLTGCGADGSGTAVLVERLQKMGLLITGGEFVALADPDPVQVRVAPDCDQGSLRFVNCAFWGLSNHVAVLEGDIYTSFSDCYFTNWKEGVPQNPIIVARAGRLQLTNSSFDTPQPSVRLESGIRLAMIRGNNGVAGVRVEDGSDGKAIVTENEPPQAVTDPKMHFPVVREDE